MIRAALIATALSLLSLCGHAQQPDRSEAAQFAAIVSNAFAKLADTIAERDTARAQVAACQAAAKAAPAQTPPSETPK